MPSNSPFAFFGKETDRAIFDINRANAYWRRFARYFDGVSPVSFLKILEINTGQ
jgi:hypothetical protein